VQFGEEILAKGTQEKSKAIY
jgi:hypothetical protein